MKLEEEFRLRCDARDIDAKKQYASRQAIVDRLSSLGNETASSALLQERAEQQRIDKAIVARQRQDTENYWQEVEAQQKKAREIVAFQVGQAAKTKSVRGKAEREDDMRQSLIWKREDDEHFAGLKQQAEQARKKREKMDDDLCDTMHTNKGVHRMELGVSDITEKEMSYHRPILARMGSTC